MIRYEWYKISEHFTGFTNYLDRVICCFCGFYNSSITDSHSKSVTNTTLSLRGKSYNWKLFEIFLTGLIWKQMFMFLIKTETSRQCCQVKIFKNRQFAIWKSPKSPIVESKIAEKSPHFAHILTNFCPGWNWSEVFNAFLCDNGFKNWNL